MRSRNRSPAPTVLRVLSYFQMTQVNQASRGWVTVFLLHNEPTTLFSVAWLRQQQPEPERKRVRNGRLPTVASCEGGLSQGQDPKPGELSMSRVKVAERRLEARTITYRKTLG